MNKRERVLQAVNYGEIDFVPYNFHAVPAVWERLGQHYSLADHHEAMAYIGASSYQASTRYEPEAHRRAYYSRISRIVFRNLRAKPRDLPSAGQ
jgi:hypothetical protein